MKLGVMQPYFFPYLGYFQLIDAVDVFVFYTDVNFVKQSWMNRNSILGRDGKLLFSIPLSNGKSGVKIHDVQISQKREVWEKKFMRTLEYSYRKAANYEVGYELVRECFSFQGASLAEFNVHSVVTLCQWMGINTKIVQSSEGYQNRERERVSRLIDICQKEGADCYVNSPGGRSLYTQEDFQQSDIKLRFLEPKLKEYPQSEQKSFVEGISIIDLVMNIRAEEVKALLSGYQIKC